MKLKLKHFLAFILLVISTFIYAQTPTLIGSASFQSSGSGASGIPTISYDIPAGNNRLMVVNMFLERNHGTTTSNSNWPNNPDGTLESGLVPPNIISVGGTATTNLDFRMNWYRFPEGAGNTRLSTHYLFNYFSDAQGLPTGNTTITFPGMNLPENAGDEMTVVIEVFENANQVPLNLGSIRENPFSATSLSFTGTAPAPPTGTANTNILYLANGYLSQQGSPLTFTAGWTSIVNISNNNTNGTTLVGTGYPNEQDGTRFLSTYRSGLTVNPTFQWTRTGTVEISRACNHIYAILPLARPSVTGTVYRDNNGLTGGINNGGTGGGIRNLANTLFINAIDTNGNVVATETVDGSGVFNFPAGGALLEGETITFQLTKNQGIVGQPAPAIELPLGWETVGESISSGPSDGTPNGEFTLTIGTTNSPNNITNRFGVTQTSGEVLCSTGVATNRLLFGYFGDNNQPSGAFAPHLQPTSQNSPISSLMTASNMTASSNVAISAQNVGSITTIRVGNINTSTTTPVDYTVFNDYIFTTWSLAADSPIVRLDATRIGTVSGGSGANFRARITVFDVATATETVVLSDALFNSAAGTQYDLSAYNLLPGKTYQIRIYLSKAGASAGTPVTLDIDNPVFYGAPIPNVTNTTLYIPCPDTTLPITTLNSNVSSQTPTNYELRWFNSSNVNVTSLTDVPLDTYTAYYFNTANNCYQPASMPVTVALVYNTLDSDGDGVPDACDLDDDNDGIVDTAECTTTVNDFITAFGTGATTDIFPSDFGLAFNSRNQNVTADLSSKFGYPANSGAVIVSITNASVHPTSNVWWTKNGQQPSIWKVTGTMSTFVGMAHDLQYYSNDSKTFHIYDNADVIPVTAAGLANQAAVAGQWSVVDTQSQKTLNNLNANDGTIEIANWRYINMNFGAKSFGFSTTVASGNPNYGVTMLLECDTDGDGIPDRLDLDSDNDGCLDAIEGGATITNSQLVNSGGTVTVGIGSSANNQNLCAGNTCVDANGIPTIAGTGQTVGDSQNAAVSSQCSSACYKPGIVDAGNTYATKHGITALQRAGSDNDNWPMVRQSAWTVLESKEKGFVVNRVATTVGLASITNPVEGMMVYDEEADCLKIYTLKSGDATMAWHCFTTPACPD